MTRGVYSKRAIFRVLLRLAWERGEFSWLRSLSQVFVVRQ